MKKLIDKFLTQTPRNKILIFVGVFFLLLWILPNTLVYLIGVVVCFYLVKKKVWRYIGLTVFSLATIISGLLLFSHETDKAQTNTNFHQLNQEVETSQVASGSQSLISTSSLETKVTNTVPQQKPSDILDQVKSYSVIKVVDGDTIDVSIDGVTERLRLIGINTPETVDPRKPVECFGIEASNKAKSVLTGKKVILESDPSQGERDKYGRLLRYVFLEDETNFNLLMIKEGYAYEYTYDVPYKYQSEFKKAQKDASDGKIGLWGNICEESGETATTGTTTANNGNSCEIKGNISSTGEKIYHMIGCGSYSKTVIDESQGERWFCSEQEALDAGWRKALNCD